MKLSVPMIATGLTITEAAGASSSKWASLRRRLSYAKIAGYSPGSQVRFFVMFFLVQIDDPRSTHPHISLPSILSAWINNKMTKHRGTNDSISTYLLIDTETTTHERR
jgi:hypothetical protein